MAVRNVVALWAALASGCAFRTFESRRVARVGYSAPPAVALIVVGDDPRFEQVALAQLTRAAPMTIVATETLPSDSRGSPEELCQRATRAEARLVLVVRAQLGSTEEFDCTDHDWDPGSGRPTYDPSDDDPFGTGTGGWRCVSSEYDHTRGWAFAGATVLDAATCALQAEQRIQTEDNDPRVIAASGTRAENAQRAVAAAEAAFRARLPRWGSELLPTGLEVVTRDGARVELIGAGAAAVRAGQRYRLRGRRDGERRQLGSLAVERASATAVTGVVAAPPIYFESDVPQPPPELRPGDELLTTSHPHDWRLMPMVAVSRIAEGDSRTLVGGAVALRWSYPRAHIHAEGLLAYHLGADSGRRAAGLAAGVGWPLGPAMLYGLGEAGHQRLTVTQSDTATLTDGSLYAGVGAGLELWLGKTLVVVDVRHRWAATGTADRATIVDATQWTFMIGVAGHAR